MDIRNGSKLVTFGVGKLLLCIDDVLGALQVNGTVLVHRRFLLMCSLIAVYFCYLCFKVFTCMYCTLTIFRIIQFLLVKFREEFVTIRLLIETIE